MAGRNFRRLQISAPLFMEILRLGPVLADRVDGIPEDAQIVGVDLISRRGVVADWPGEVGDIIELTIGSEEFPPTPVDASEHSLMEVSYWKDPSCRLP